MSFLLSLLERLQLRISFLIQYKYNKNIERRELILEDKTFQVCTPKIVPVRRTFFTNDVFLVHLRSDEKWNVKRLSTMQKSENKTKEDITADINNYTK